MFRYFGGGWHYETALEPSGGDAEDGFGWSVAIDNDVMLVGAIGDEVEGIESGSVYVFRETGGLWIEQAILVNPNGTVHEFFGRSVAISGGVAVIGVPRNDDAGPDAGCAFVFRDGGSRWSLEAQLIPSDAAPVDEFGVSVAMAGNLVVVGAFRDDDNGSSSGSAYVFEYGGRRWNETSKLVASDGANVDWFGFLVAASECANTILVGAPLDDAPAIDSGSAYLFHRDDDARSREWSQLGKITASDSGPTGFFGVSMAMDGNLAVIGAEDQGDLGAAYVFAGPFAIDCNRNGEPDACDIWRRDSTDRNGNGVPDECEVIGDANGDGLVDVDDLIEVILNWGPCSDGCPPQCVGDLNGDCQVSVDDLLVVVLYWGDA